MAERKKAEHRGDLHLILYSRVKRDRALPGNDLGPGPGESGGPKGQVWVTADPT